MAIWKHKPTKELIWHTDRGSQYSSDSQNHFKRAPYIQSMSNLRIIVMLSRQYEYIGVFYNLEGIHSTNNYLSPDIV
jgi:transposase InsO family protein